MALGIQRRHYETWIDALIEAVATCDPQFDAEVEASWRAVMEEVVDLMLAE